MKHPITFSGAFATAARGRVMISSMTAPVVLDVQEVSFHYWNRGRRETVLRGVTLAVRRGEIVVLVGPSGSGKSTLLRLLNRLQDPHEGRILLEGRDLRHWDPLHLRRRVALVLQTPYLLEGTVRDNLRIAWSDGAPSQTEALMRDALESVGLPPDMLDRPAHHLSVGEKQRVGLARTLLTRPEVLLLDEPTSALDPANVSRFLEVLKDLNRRERLTVVVVTHQSEAVRILGGRKLLLEEGRLVDPETARA